MPDPMPDPQQNSTAPAWSQNVTTGAPAAGNGPPPPPDMEAAPQPIKPDGGILGNAVLGSLAQATKPPDMEAAPADMESAGVTANANPPSPSLWQKIKPYVTFNPLLTPLHMAADATANAANQKAQEIEQKNLADIANNVQSPYKFIGTQTLRDAAEDSASAFRTAGSVAGLVSGATSPEAATLAAVGATGPIGATATGLYMVGHGLYGMVQGWGDVSNPDVLQNELNSLAETVGGGAGLTEGAKGVVQAYKNKTANTPNEQYIHFKNAVPPTKTAPYTELDYHAARPYLDAEHTTGTPVESIATTVDAADSAIEKIEGKVDSVIKANPDVLVHVNPIDAAQQVLRGSVRTDFLEAGLKELEKYPLGFERQGPTIAQGAMDEPLTLQRADDIRRQLNDDNRSLMKSKNNYDIANMMNTDPAFAARQAAAEALRSGIYDTLEQLGLKDARQMRLDEGSLIKIRNAAERQRFNAEKSVKTAVKPSLAKKVAKKAAVGVGAAAGFELGSKVGHPLIGSAMGAEVGSEASEMLTPKALTRDELIQKAFEPIVKPQPVQTNGAGIPGVVAGQAPQAVTQAPPGFLHVQGSDGNEYHIPESQLNHAREVDPGLQILNPQPAAPPQ